MNRDVIRESLQYDFEWAAGLLRRFAAIGQTVALSQYSPLTDAMSRISQQIELLDAGRADIPALRETMQFAWGVLEESEWQFFEVQERENPNWRISKVMIAKSEELRRRDALRQSR